MKVSAREKKVLYAGIAIAVVILIYQAATVFSPGDGESIAEKVNTQESILIRQQELIGREDFYKKRIEDAENDIEQIRTRLLPGNNGAAATTELIRILSDFAENSGVIIQTKSNLPERKVTDSDSLIKGSARIEIQCSEAGLVDFLTAVKNYDKFLKMEELVINAVPQQKQLVIRNPTVIVAGYISVPPPSESTAKPGEDAAQATAAASREAIKR